MLDYRKTPHLGIAGNKMRRSTTEKIVPDDRWKTELNRFDLVRFLAVAGPLNASHGYKSGRRERHKSTAVAREEDGTGVDLASCDDASYPKSRQ